MARAPVRTEEVLYSAATAVETIALVPETLPPEENERKEF